MTNRKAPIEVLERLAMAICEDDDADRLVDMSAHCRAALDKLRAATAPLRTETEVVLDIGHHVRACVRHGALMWTDEEKRKLEDLANEHTVPVPWDTPAPLRTRADVDAGIVRLVRICGSTLDVPPALSPSLYQLQALSALRDEPTTDSGSSSATAAKESRDNAGVSAGPTKEHEALPWDAEDQKLADPCSCDEAIELRRVIKHVHSLALEVARVTEAS